MKLMNSYKCCFIFITIIFIASIHVYIISDSSVVNLCNLCIVQFCIVLKELFLQCLSLQGGAVYIKEYCIIIL